MIVYLLLDENSKDYLGQHFELGKQYTKPGSGNHYEQDWFIAYQSQLVAAFVYPAFENFSKPTMYKAWASGRVHNDGLRVSATKLLVQEKITFPEVALLQRQHFALLVSATLIDNMAIGADYSKWVSDCMDGKIDKEKAIEIYNRFPWGISTWNRFACMALASVCGLTFNDEPAQESDLHIFAAASGIQAVLETHGHIDLEVICQMALMAPAPSK